MQYGVVLTNHNIPNRISKIHLIIIVLEETNTKGNVTRNAAIFDRSKYSMSQKNPP